MLRHRKLTSCGVIHFLTSHALYALETVISIKNSKTVFLMFQEKFQTRLLLFSNLYHFNIEISCFSGFVYVVLSSMTHTYVLCQKWQDVRKKLWIWKTRAQISWHPLWGVMSSYMPTTGKHFSPPLNNSIAVHKWRIIFFGFTCATSSYGERLKRFCF